MELLIATALTGLVTTAIFTTVSGSLRTHEIRSQSVRMEANLRAALELMTRELRMATFTATLPAGYEAASGTYLPFVYNGEARAYRLNTAGILQRKVAGGVFMPVAEEIESLEFYYLLDDGSGTTSPADYGRIRGITVSLLARTASADPGYSSAAEYARPGGPPWGPFPDGYRRSLLATTVFCRNTGL